MKKTIFIFLTLYCFLAIVLFAIYFFSKKYWLTHMFLILHGAENLKDSFPLNTTGHSQVTETSEVWVNKSAGEEFLGACPETPPNLLGPFQVELETVRTLEDVRKQVGSLLQVGGRYKPPDCISKQKVAVIIPFRNRHENLTHWLYYLHPFLQRQQLDYGVYVINQDGDGTFNRAKLMNIGYAEALKEDDYNCFLFSDVDLVPLDDRNLYRCFSNPRHLSVAVDKFDYKLPYEKIFGGVTALTKEQFLTVNGFSNTFWGWGGEDDDLYNRVMLRIKAISRPYAVIGRYKMIKHERDLHNDQNLNNVKKLKETTNTLDQDGLSSLNYTVIDITKNMLFTFITVDVHVPMGLTKK
nr:beta-1,4-galactosyltransferase 1 [Nothobranchius furzeri]